MAALEAAIQLSIVSAKNRRTFEFETVPLPGSRLPCCITNPKLT
jgi:hypothetical protein